MNKVDNFVYVCRSFRDSHDFCLCRFQRMAGLGKNEQATETKTVRKEPGSGRRSRSCTCTEHCNYFGNLAHGKCDMKTFVTREESARCVLCLVFRLAG